MENTIKQHIQDALQVPKAQISNIKQAGGMTNLNYSVAINSKSYIVRIAGKGTDKLIDREVEKRNLELASSLGINPKLYYFNLESGLKITKEIAGAQTFTAEIAKEEMILQEVVSIFRRLHHSNKVMEERFRLFELMVYYEELAKQAAAHFYEGYEAVKEDIQTLHKRYENIKVKEVPTHIDPAFSNFIVSEVGKVYLIDWEYSGMFDPLWDLAAYSLEAKFSLEEEQVLLEAYFQRVPSESENERIFLHKIFQDYLWSLWTLFKEEKGDDFGAYGEIRFERARLNIAKYKRQYEFNQENLLT